MITEQEFLQALKTVKEYQAQINELAEQARLATPSPIVKNGDIIKLTAVGKRAKTLKVGTVLRVVSFEVRPINRSRFQQYIDDNFRDECRNFYGKEWDNWYYKKLMESNFEYFFCIRTAKHFFTTDEGYAYQLIRKITPSL